MTTFLGEGEARDQMEELREGWQLKRHGRLNTLRESKALEPAEIHSENNGVFWDRGTEVRGGNNDSSLRITVPRSHLKSQDCQNR